MHILYVFVYRSVCIKLQLFQNIYQNTQSLKKKKVFVTRFVFELSRFYRQQMCRHVRVVRVGLMVYFLVRITTTTRFAGVSLGSSDGGGALPIES